MLPAVRAQNILYITDGDNAKLQAIDLTTHSILFTTTTSAGAAPIAVRNTIALGFNQNNGLTGEYDLVTGALIGSLQTPSGPTNWSLTRDGAASATANYTSSDANVSGLYTIYQTAPDWSGATPLFTVGIQPFGIAYDSASDTFWINSGNIYQYTSTGLLVSFFGLGSSALTYEYSGLAYQASTDTLWVVPNNNNANLRQYSKSGTILQSFAVPGRFGSVFGAEFSAIPEPSTYALFGGLAALLALARRRRLA